MVTSVMLVVEDLESKGYQHCGPLRVAARKLTRYEADAEGPPRAERDDVCGRCGAEIEQKPRGRPRVWCSDACRKAAWAERRNATK